MFARENRKVTIFGRIHIQVLKYVRENITRSLVKLYFKTYPRLKFPNKLD